MKTLLALLALAVPLHPLAAQGSRSPAAHPAAPAAAGELASLERFLTLSDAELGQLADAIARVRAMTPAQRTALRDEIAAYRQLPEAQRLQIRQGWGGVPPEIQAGWREMMQNANAEEHAAIQSRLQALSPEEKVRYRRNLVEVYLKAKAAQKK